MTISEAWHNFGGIKLESVLQEDAQLGESAVRLIDARFIIALCKVGGIIIRRQELPENAFLSIQTLKKLRKGGKANDCLRVISISQYVATSQTRTFAQPWMHPRSQIVADALLMHC